MNNAQWAYWRDWGGWQFDRIIHKSCLLLQPFVSIFSAVPSYIHTIAADAAFNAQTSTIWWPYNCFDHSFVQQLKANSRNGRESIWESLGHKCTNAFLQQHIWWWTRLGNRKISLVCIQLRFESIAVYIRGPHHKYRGLVRSQHCDVDNMPAKGDTLAPILAKYTS